jgi:hypothetical protein
MWCEMGSGDIAIRVKGLGKKYSIGGPQEKYLTFRDAIVNSVKAPFRRFTSHSPHAGFRDADAGAMILVSVGVEIVLLISDAFSFRKMGQDYTDVM